MSWDIFPKAKIQYFLQKLKDKFVQKETGKGLSTNDFVANNAVLTTDKTPFLTRQTLNPTGFSGYVREKLIGASYAWNQLVQNGNFANGITSWACIKGSVSVSNGIATVTPSEYDCQMYESFVGRYVVGHKYLVTGRIKTSGTTDIHLRFLRASKRVEQVSTWQTVSMIAIAPADVPSGYQYVWFNDLRTSGLDAWQCTEIQVIDLTLAFGSTIADYLYSLANNGGITKLRDMGFPIDKYTAYGNYLVSSKTSGKKIVGKNLFNADILLQAEGWTKDSNGVYSGPTNTPYGIWKLANGGFPDIYFEPNKRYVFTCTGRVSVANKWMAFEYQYSDGTTSRKTFGNTTDATVTFVSDANKTVVAFGTIYGDVATCYMSNIQLEQGITATTYAPYAPVTYPLGNDELRGKFDLVNGEIVASGDVKESNGKITRVRKRINLGDINWDYVSNGNFFQSQAVISEVNVYGVCISAKYVNDTPSTGNSTDKIIGFTSSKYLRVRDTAYNDATAFKTAMDGVYFEYPLATPTTEQSTPFADPMSMVGATTEEYIDTRDIPCPVGAERQYMGQSADVILVPSKPHADGVSMLMCASSGGKEQYYWDASFMQAFQDGCDEIMGAVAAKGVTPASNSPDDISKAIRSLVTYEQPIEFDYRCGYITNGVWYYENPTDTLSDIYEVKNGHTYYMFFGNVTGTRFRAITTTTDIRTVTSGTITGDQTIKNSSNPGALSYVTFTSTVDGYFIVCKDNVGKTGITTYMQDRTTM